MSITGHGSFLARHVGDVQGSVLLNHTSPWTCHFSILSLTCTPLMTGTWIWVCCVYSSWYC